MSLYAAPETLPFGIGLALIVAIALLEGIGMMMAMSPSNWLDDLLPDVSSDSGLDKLLGWLHLGKVPSLVLLILFLMGYTVFGYSLQMACHGLLGFYLPGWLAGLLAVPSGLATVRGLGALIARIIPKDESSAVSETTLIGRTGTVSGGTARRGLAAQARVKDALGRTHYLMVEPDLDDEFAALFANPLIVRKVGAFHRCIVNPHPGLM